MNEMNYRKWLGMRRPRVVFDLSPLEIDTSQGSSDNVSFFDQYRLFPIDIVSTDLNLIANCSEREPF